MILVNNAEDNNNGLAYKDHINEDNLLESYKEQNKPRSLL